MVKYIVKGTVDAVNVVEVSVNAVDRYDAASKAMDLWNLVTVTSVRKAR